ncbi:hypothetical protein GCM10027612_88070 [Microbispora bryophytorum subsp. camponoti]
MRVAHRFGSAPTPEDHCAQTNRHSRRGGTGHGVPDRRTPATAEEGPEQIPNGTFDTTTDPWWHTANLNFELSDGRLCSDVPAGTTNPWDAIVGVNDIPLVKDETYAFSFFATANPGKVARAYVQLPTDPYTQYVSAAPELSVSGNTYSYTFTSPVDLPDAQVVFQIGGSATAWRFCVDNVSLKGGAPPEVYTPDTGPRVRVNQVAYLPKGPKNATVVTDAAEALPWQLKNSAGTVVAHGTTTPRGDDASSGQNVHSIDFGAYTKAGTGYTLTADGETSRRSTSSRRVRRPQARRAEVLLHPAQRDRDRRRPASRLRPARRSRGRRPQPGRHERPVPAGRLRLPSTCPAAGTTRATTASTSSTAASRWPSS